MVEESALGGEAAAILGLGSANACFRCSEAYLRVPQGFLGGVITLISSVGSIANIGRMARGWLAAVVLTVSACTSEPPRNPVPYEHIDRVEVVDMPGVRVWGDELSDVLHQDLVKSIQDERRSEFPRGPDGAFQYSGLSLSGGGDHGAFGAGFLKGWSESGSRPTFKIVSGISTGALIAPFALLGSAYDRDLETAYTTVSAADIYETNSIVGAYWRESLSDNHPLQELVHKFVGDKVIDAVAQAHRNGQRLFVGTTNLDTQRQVIWNMGVIANSRHPEAYDFFRKILVASASIPVLFPPVYVEVEADGVVYDEMHVDGGTVGQMFFYGASIRWRRVLSEASGIVDPIDRSTLFLIIDGEIDPELQHVPRRLVPITNRTISTLVKVSAWSALYRMYLHSQADGYGFQFVGLPDDYEPESSHPYDPTEMRRMFDIGYEMGRSGKGWRTTPPGF